MNFVFPALNRFALPLRSFDPMNLSLIVTTYNWEKALLLVLKSALAQRTLPAEIIIGDDGSRPDTAALIQRLALDSPVPIQHIWQEDKGFRAAKIRNKAIAASQGDYIVMIDGDMVLHPLFIADHIAAARTGFFVQGGRLKAGKIQAAKLLDGNVFRLGVTARDIKNRKNAINSKILSRLSSFESRGLTGIRTCNFAAWRHDIYKINGFDESYEGWGREDSDFALRLLKAGVRRYNLKFQANAIHLHHCENSRDNLGSNDALLLKATEAAALRCLHGIDHYL
ncbi:MAG: glycosyltransferase family 2 protein [Geopsychrobacter sp.]|nr:glycosyltransferase family 2 protein [Geopsychrobacter sp.]